MNDFRNRYLEYTGIMGCIQLEFLDSIDFLPLLKNNSKVYDVMRDVRDKYDYGPLRHKIPEEFDSDSFHDMDEEEFANYISDRYGDQFIVSCCTSYSEWYEVHPKINEVCIYGANS